MPKFKVPFKVEVTVYVEVDANDVDDAIEKASEEVYLEGYVGNGGKGDKIVGVSDENMTVYPSEDFEPMEDDVEEI
jgi:hypothetical protein